MRSPTYDELVTQVSYLRTRLDRAEAERDEYKARVSDAEHKLRAALDLAETTQKQLGALIAAIRNAGGRKLDGRTWDEYPEAGQ